MDDVVEEMIVEAGFDLQTLSMQDVNRVALANAAREMASVKFGKDWNLLTETEVEEASRNPETVGDSDLSARTIRAGETFYIWFLTNCGCYDRRFADWRLGTNKDLDKGDRNSLLAQPSSPSRRQAGKPGSSARFWTQLAVDVEYRRASGEASSTAKVLEMLTGRDRNGPKIADRTPLLVLPNGMKSYRTLTSGLRQAALDAPSLIEEARQQGEINKAGGQPDPAFMARLAQIRRTYSDPAAVQSMLQARRRKI